MEINQDGRATPHGQPRIVLVLGHERIRLVAVAVLSGGIEQADTVEAESSLKSGHARLDAGDLGGILETAVTPGGEVISDLTALAEEFGGGARRRQPAADLSDAE